MSIVWCALAIELLIGSAFSTLPPSGVILTVVIGANIIITLVVCVAKPRFMIMPMLSAFLLRMIGIVIDNYVFICVGQRT